MKNFVTVSFLLICNLCFAQVKYEREYDLPISEIPQNAIAFTTEYFSHVKLKWYAEESDKGKSIEAKSYKRGESYSIEFTPEGILEDIEKTVKFSSLKANVRNSIEAQFEDDFDRFKVRKTQIQWSGELASIQKFIKTQEMSEDFKLAYEIEVEGRKNGNAAMYEYLFSQDGKVLSQREIETRSTVNLEF